MAKEGRDGLDDATLKQLSQEHASRRFRPAEQYLGVHLKSGRTVTGKSFRAIMGSPEVLNELPIGFDASFSCGEVRGAVEISSTGLGNADARVRVFPAELRASTESFITISQWFETYRAPAWQRWWRSVVGFHWIVFWICLLALLAFLADQEGLALSRAVRLEAESLLEKGVRTDAEKAKAIDLLLHSAARKPQPGAVPTAPPTRFITITVILFVICLVLSFPPKIVLGFGKGKRRIQLWKGWLRVLSVTIPGILVLPWIGDTLRKFAGSLFS